MIDIRDWIAVHASRRPESLAQIDHATGRHFTYAEMDHRVSMIAGYLDKVVSIKPGDVVAVLGDNSSDIFDIDFACGRLGAIFLPMNTRLAAPEIAFQLTDARPKILFVGKGYEAVANIAVKDSQLSITVSAYGQQEGSPHLDEMVETGPSFEGNGPRSAEDGWTLIYSSGTTGRPKGVLHTHGGVTMQAIGNCVPLGLSPKSRNLTVLPLFHISGLNIFAHAIFYAGGTQITMERFDPTVMLSTLADPDFGVTHFCAVPTIFEMIAQTPGFEGTDLSTIEGAFVGGAPSTEFLLNTYAKKGMPLIQGYGLTETGPALTVLDNEDAIRKLGSAGKPIMHVNLRIVGPDDENLEPGDIGEILAKGPSVITEYYNRPEAQETDFTEGWLRTGDMGFFDEEGYLFLRDRKKDMYISGGENVYPAEVENVISDLADVLQVAVIGIPDETWGETGAAYIVRRPGSDLSEDEVLSHCSDQIARYKVPKFVTFMESLPLGGSGKVLKTELRKLLV